MHLKIHHFFKDFWMHFGTAFGSHFGSKIAQRGAALTPGPPLWNHPRAERAQGYPQTPKMSAQGHPETPKIAPNGTLWTPNGTNLDPKILKKQ